MNRIVFCFLATLLFALLAMTASAADTVLDNLSNKKDCELAAKGIVDCYILASYEQDKLHIIENVAKKFSVLPYVKESPQFFNKRMINAVSINGAEFYEMNKGQDLIGNYSRKVLESWQIDALCTQTKKTPDAPPD